jgi:hypothetical protein
LVSIHLKELTAMPTQPHKPAPRPEPKPASPPAKPPSPPPHNTPEPAKRATPSQHPHEHDHDEPTRHSPDHKHEAAKPAHRQPLAIGERPDDPKDPQAAKFEAHAVPPRWDEPEQTRPHPTTWVDSPPVADEQRERAEEFEKRGIANYVNDNDTRPEEDRPKFQKDALAGGGAFVTPGAQRQIPGVAPPVRKE